MKDDLAGTCLLPIGSRLLLGLAILGLSAFDNYIESSVISLESIMFCILSMIGMSVEGYMT